MIADLLDYKVQKQMARIDKLVTELVIVRKYIYSVKAGFAYCGKHLARGDSVVSISWPGGSELKKNQEQLLTGLRKAEKRIKKQLSQASRELGRVYGHSGGAGKCRIEQKRP
jgi:hypothetical protein